MFHHGLCDGGIGLEKRAGRDAEVAPQQVDRDIRAAGQHQRPGRAEVDYRNGQLLHAQFRRLRVAALQDDLDVIFCAQAQTDALDLDQRFEVQLRPQLVQRRLGQVTLLDGKHLL